MASSSDKWEIRVAAFGQGHWFLAFLSTKTILRKTFGQLIINTGAELAAMGGELARCPSGGPFIRTIEYRVPPRPVVQSANGDPRLVAAFTTLLGNISSHQNTAPDTYRIEGVRLILNTSAQDFIFPRDPVENAVVNNTPPLTVDCVSSLHFEGYVRPEPMLHIASALNGLPSITLKVDEDIWRGADRHRFRHQLGQTLVRLPASVRHINIGLINTNTPLATAIALPNELMEDGADPLASMLRDTARRNHYQSLTMHTRRISQEYLWPQGVQIPDSVPPWPDMEEVHIHFEPQTAGEVPEDIAGRLNTLFAAAGYAAQRMPRLRQMTILVTLEGAGTQRLQYLRDGPGGGPRLSSRVSKGHIFSSDFWAAWKATGQWSKEHTYLTRYASKRNYYATLPQPIGQ